MLRLLDTFSGIGGFSYAAERIVGGYETVAFVEREPFCQKVLRKHWPDVPIHDDITTFTPTRGSADVICGGFPCQDISTAGKQAGIKEGTRSGLFYELMRVIRLVQPQFVILENVSAILANGLDTVLGELASAGFDAEWACIPASAVGACHQRDRWWLIAYPASRSGFWEQQSNRQAQHNQEDDGSELSVAQLGDTHCPPLPAAYSNSRFRGFGRQQLQGSSLPRELSELCQNDFGCARGLSGASKETANAAHTNSQRQQKQQPPAITNQEGRTRWGDAPRQLNPNWNSYLSQPVLCRGDDGLSGRVDRLKALGNAVVPQVAAIPLKRVRDLSEGDSS